MNNLDANIKIGERVFRYRLLRKKVKNINIRIKSDGIIYVSAASFVSRANVEDILLKKQEFIISAFERLENSQNRVKISPTRLENGEEIYVFGKKYSLMLSPSCPPHKSGEVYISGERLVICHKASDNSEKIRAVLEKWQCESTHAIITELVKEAYLPFVKKMPTIKLRKMISRWGSCQPQKGILTFNSYLSCVPLECIRLVAYHELCHFLHPDHSREFYQCLEKYIPDYKKKNQLLKRYSPRA